jgi:hypothetical protein
MIDLENTCIKCGEKFKARACIGQVNNPDHAWIVECRLCCGFVFGPTAEVAEQTFRDGQRWGTNLIKEYRHMLSLVNKQS